MDEIVEVLSKNNGQHLVAITGPPGYGKTCLAQRIGHRMLEKQFKVIFLSLRNIKSVDKMSAKILRALNICQGLANKQCDLAKSELRSLTTKTILILDNPEDLLIQQDTRRDFNNFVDHISKFAQNVKCVIASRVWCSASSHHLVKLLALKNDAATNLLQVKVQEGTMSTLKDHEDTTTALRTIQRLRSCYKEKFSCGKALVENMRGIIHGKTFIEFLCFLLPIELN